MNNDFSKNKQKRSQNVEASQGNEVNVAHKKCSESVIAMYRRCDMGDATFLLLLTGIQQTKLAGRQAPPSSGGCVG